MSDDLDRSHPLYRKIGASPKGGAGGNGALRRAFRMVLARAAEEFSGMQAIVMGLGKEPRAIDQLMDDLAEVPVIFVLEGAGESLAMAIMDHQMIAALLEHATTGRVISGQAEARAPTRTDATICGEFLDRALQGLAEEFADVADGPDVAGYRYGYTLKDARAVELAFDDVPFHKFEVSLDFEDGAKSGVLSLILPDRSVSVANSRGRGGQDWSAAWSEQVQLAPVTLEAVLTRKKLRLAEISSWEVGSVLNLPEAGLSHVTLVGQNGQIVARGKLGRQGGDKAIRVEVVTSEPEPEQSEPQGFVAGAGSAAPPLGLPSMPPAGMAPPMDAPMADPMPAAAPLDMGTPAPIAMPAAAPDGADPPPPPPGMAMAQPLGDLPAGDAAAPDLPAPLPGGPMPMAMPMAPLDEPA